MYPSAHEFRARSDHSDPDEAFEDLHRSDLILAAGRVARRKIRQLELNPYPSGLLRRGLDKFGDEERGGQEFLLGLEYSVAVGVTVMDVVADVNEQALQNDRCLETQVDAANGRVDDVMMEIDVIHQRVESAEEDLADVFQRMRRMEDRVEGLEQRLADSQRDVAMLVFEREELAGMVDFLQAEQNRMNENLNNLGLAWFDQEAEYQVMRGNVDQLMAFRVALNHGPNNPIVVDDDDTVFEEADGEELEVNGEDELDARIAAGELIPFDLADEGRLLMGGEDLPDYE